LHSISAKFSKKTLSFLLKAFFLSESISISPKTFFPFLIGTTISDLVETKQDKYLLSAFTSATISVLPLLAAEPQIPLPIGIFVCSVACSPLQGPKTKLLDFTR